MLLKPSLLVTPQPYGTDPGTIRLACRMEGSQGGLGSSQGEHSGQGKRERREPSLGRRVHMVEVAPGWSEGQSLGEKSELELQKQGLPIWRVRASGGLNSRGRVASC